MKKLKAVKGWLLVNLSGKIPQEKTRERYKVYRRKEFARVKAFEHHLDFIPVLISPLPKKGKK